MPPKARKTKAAVQAKIVEDAIERTANEMVAFALLRVSKLLLAETAPVAYGANVFEFDCFRDAEVFLETISGMRLYVRAIKFGRYAYEKSKTRRIFDFLADAVALRSIRINHHTVCSGSDGNNYRTAGATEFVKMCRPAFEKMHKARKTDSVAVPVLDLLQVDAPQLCYHCKKKVGARHSHPQRKLFIEQPYNNIQHTSKTKASASARAEQAEEPANKPLPAVMSGAAFKDWDGSTKLAGSGGELSENDAQWKATKNKFAQVVEVMQNEAFFLKLLTVTEGPHKDCNILMLMPVKENEHILFLELPPELSKMKYAFHLLDHDPVKICTDEPAKTALGPKRAVFADLKDSTKHEGLTWNAATGKCIHQGLSNFAILRVNKQPFEEAVPTAYENRLSFPDFSDATIFFKAIGSMIVHIKHVAIEGLYSKFNSDGRAMFVLLAKAIKLGSLYIMLGHIMMGAHAQHAAAEVGTEFQASPIIVSEALLTTRGKESETRMLVSNWVLCVCDVLFGWHNVQCTPEGLRVGTAAIAIANSGGLFVVLCILTKRWFWPVEPQDGDAAEQGVAKKAV
ncbi:hypothetical protein LTR42_006102 [Elasticomyces elasticus]|nr:hypothetical protein LTR42_006102 [Elasticomyces elasticus]